MTTFKNKRSDQFLLATLEPERHLRCDPDLRELEAACELWHAGGLTEEAYIDRVVAIAMREVDGLPMSAQGRELITDALRLRCWTDAAMRASLQLDPFGADD